MVGKCLSHYRILTELGRGGMGIVYKAEDMKLDRTVAIKVLPSAALTSEGDRARFYREAKAAARLHHPHIAGIYEIDEAVPRAAKEAPGAEEEEIDAAVASGAKDEDLRPFIAMEYVEGETLGSRIQEGPLKLAEAVRIASQIASGLEAAHEKNIVHRDIKSGNVILTKKGEAKILDFGLAKTDASTVLTREGTTLGTVAYMSPEQARGEEVDPRTDIWSLGVVLYEMISGRHPFPGEYEQAVVYEILNQDPEPLTALRTGVPMALEWMVTKCLAKNVDARYQSATELLVDLRNVDLKGSGSSGSSDRTLISDKTGVGPAQSLDERLPALKAAQRAWPLLAASILLSFAAGYFLSSTGATHSASDTLRTLPLYLDGIREAKYPAISPTSDYIAFTGTDSVGQNGIFLLDTRRGVIDYMRGTDGAVFPSFSPDGGWLAYNVTNFLYRVAVPRGVPEQIESDGRYALWQDQNHLIKSGASGVARIDLNGGTSNWIFKADTSFGVGSFSYLWTIDRESGLMIGAVLSDNFTASTLLFVDRKSGAASYGAPGIFSPMYIPGGLLVYQLEDQASQPIVRPFDVRTRAFTGPPLAELPAMHWDSYSVGSDGSLLVVRTARTTPGNPVQLFVVDIAGHSVEKKKAYFYPKYSPARPSFSNRFDKVVVEYASQVTGESVIATYNLDTDFASRLTFGSSLHNPQWSADDSTVYFSSVESESGGIYRRRIGEGGIGHLVVPGGFQSNPSPDGEWLAFVRLSAWSGPDIYVFNLETGDEIAIDTTRAETNHPDFSPDSRYLVFTNYPDPGVAVRPVDGSGYEIVSDRVARSPKWSADGKYIYFLVVEDGIYRVPISLKPGYQVVGVPERIVSVRGQSPSFDIDSTGNRLIVAANGVDFRPAAEGLFSTLVWTRNWAQSLVKK